MKKHPRDPRRISAEERIRVAREMCLERRRPVSVTELIEQSIPLTFRPRKPVSHEDANKLLAILLSPADSARSENSVNHQVVATPSSSNDPNSGRTCNTNEHEDDTACPMELGSPLLPSILTARPGTRGIYTSRNDKCTGLTSATSTLQPQQQPSICIRSVKSVVRDHDSAQVAHCTDTKAAPPAEEWRVATEAHHGPQRSRTIYMTRNARATVEQIEQQPRLPQGILKGIIDDVWEVEDIIDPHVESTTMQHLAENERAMHVGTIFNPLWACHPQEIAYHKTTSTVANRPRSGVPRGWVRKTGSHNASGGWNLHAFENTPGIDAVRAGRYGPRMLAGMSRSNAYGGR